MKICHFVNLSKKPTFVDVVGNSQKRPSFCKRLLVPAFQQSAESCQFFIRVLGGYRKFNKFPKELKFNSK